MNEIRDMPRFYGQKSAGGDNPDPVVISAELKRIGDAVREEGAKALREAEKAGALSTELKTTVDSLLLKYNELQATLDDVAQKQARAGKGRGDETPVKTIGQQVVESAPLKQWIGDGARVGRAVVSVKAVTTANAGAAVPPDYRPEIIGLPQRKMTVRDLMLPGSTASNAITYVRETGFTNNAAPTAETTKKPESTLTLESVIQSVITIPHFLKAAKQILDDAPQLVSFIDGRLRYGLQYAEELQLLKGSGVGVNLNGIYTQATAYAAPITPPGTLNPRIDLIRLAMLQAFLAEFPPTGIVMNPSDWAAIELTKDGQQRYILGDPQGVAQPRLWGLPVVETQAMTADTALVGAFRPMSQIFDREETNVVVATENEDDFVKNMITIRAEERLAMAVYRPEAFVKIADLTPP